MKTQIKKYAGAILAGTIVIGGIASAAITPIPTISNTFAVAGQVIKSADLNKLAEAVNILDARTNGTAPTDPNHLADKEYVDSKLSSPMAFRAPVNVSDLTQSYQASDDIVLTSLVYGTNDTAITICMADEPSKLSGTLQSQCPSESLWVARAYSYASASTIIPKGMYWKAFTYGGGGHIVQ